MQGRRGETPPTRSWSPIETYNLPKESNMNRMTLKAAAAAALLLASTLSLAAGPAPDATVDFSAGSVAAGVGYTWGHGTLHYHGKDYRFSLKGLSVPAIGAERIQASGEVFHLGKVSDFSGNYTALSAGATVAGGASIAEMKNQNGAVIRVHSTTQGLDFNVSLDGVSIKLAQAR
jgi:hypothetical protein